MVPLDPAAAFTYLGHTIAYNNSDWASLYKNLVKVSKRWGMLSRVVEKTGTTERAGEMLYKVVVV